MTFENLCEEEPKLKILYEQVKVTRIGRGETVNSVWYHKIKPQMKFLVGFLSQKKSLQNTQAYDLTYSTLYDLLRSRKGRRGKGN